MKKNILFYLLIGVVLLLSDPLQAHDIYFDKPTISLQYDFQHNKAKKRTNQVHMGQQLIWASTWIHGAAPSSKIKIQWYHEKSGKKYQIFSESIYAEGNKPLVSVLDSLRVKPLHPGNYGVLFTVNGKNWIEARFQILPGNSRENLKQRQKFQDCQYPSEFSDRNLIARLAETVPGIKAKLKIFGLQRVYAKDYSYGIIAPAGWRRFSVRGPRLMEYRQPSSRSVSAKTPNFFRVERYRIGKKFLEKYTPEKFVTFYIRDSFKRSRHRDKRLSHLMTRKDSGGVIGRYLETFSDNFGNRRYAYHMIRFRNRMVYDFYAEVDPADQDLGKFLSILAVFSLWTKERCTGKTRHATIRKSTVAEGGKSALRDCLDPGSEADRQSIAGLLSLYPGINGSLQRLPISRHLESAKGVSLIIPNNWKKKARPDSGYILEYENKTGNSTFEFSISRITVPPEKRNLGIVVKVARMLAQTIMDDSAKDKELKAKIVSRLKSTSTNDGHSAVAHLLLEVEGNGEKIYIGVGTYYDGKDIYMMALTTDTVQRSVTEFLIAMAVRTFRSNELCRSGASLFLK